LRGHYVDGLEQRTKLTVIGADRLNEQSTQITRYVLISVVQPTLVRQTNNGALKSAKQPVRMLKL